MGKGRKTTITIKLPPLARRDFEKFMERLSKALTGETVIGEIRGDMLRLHVYGSRLAIERTMRLVRQLIAEYSTPREGQRKRYSLKAISREARLAVPPDVLTTILENEGYTAVVRDEELETDAPPEAVLNAAQRLADAVRRLALVNASRTAKKVLLALLSLYPDMQPQDAVSLLLSSGYAFEDEEGRIYLRGDWREVLKSLVEDWIEGGDRE